MVCERIEGNGKTFHINNVTKCLKKKKYDFIKLREPGGSKNSELIRKLILHKRSKFTANTELLLYLAARSENLSILRKYYKKKIILIDRCVDETIAYKNDGLGGKLDFIK